MVDNIKDSQTKCQSAMQAKPTCFVSAHLLHTETVARWRCDSV